MAKASPLESKLSAEGRVVVPREVRVALGVSSGDRIVFHVDEEGLVRLSTPRLMAMSVWANNEGGDGGDSAEDVRQARSEDQDEAEAKYALIADEQASDARSEDEVAADLLAALGLR
jgi:AbrB family looped-hinge helix DNA binding protein